MNLRWMIDLNVKPKSVIFLEQKESIFLFTFLEFCLLPGVLFDFLGYIEGT